MIATTETQTTSRAQPATSSDPRERLLQGWGVEQQNVRVDGINTSVLSIGAGPPLLLLHGGIECGGVYWRPVTAQLAEHFRVLMPDLPGLGESEPFAQLTHATFEKWFGALLRWVGPERPALVAHSLLGSLAARYAAQHSQQLRQLVLYGAPGVGPYRMSVKLLVTAIRFDLRPTPANHERFERFALLDRERTRLLDPAWFDAFSAYSLERAHMPHVKRTMRKLVSLGTKPVPDDELRRVRVPTTVCWGRHDRMAPLQLAERAHDLFGWTLRTIVNAAHVPHMEQPEQFAATLDALLLR